MPGDIDTLVTSILNRRAGDRFVVGIDGLSRAGKTTAVDKIQQRLIENNKSVCVFHIDDHIVERKKRNGTGFAQWHEYYKLQWDVGYLRRKLFEKLRDAPEISLPFYDSERDETANKTVIVPDNCIVVVEGVFLQRPEWREFFDFVVYLDCPRATRFERE